MVNNIKISVIVPVYNAQESIGKCIDSILDQTFKNVEIILVNDGSSDNTLSICQQYAEKHSNIYLIDQVNQGVASARNQGLKVATGDVITFVDSDDYIANEMYEVMLSEMKRTDADVVEAGFYRQYKASCRTFRFKKEFIEGQNNLVRHVLERKNTFDGSWNKLYRKRIINDIRFQPLSYSEDFLFNFEVHKNAHRKLVLSDVFYYYVDNPGAAVSAPFNEKKLDILKAGEMILDFDIVKRNQHFESYVLLYLLRNALTLSYQANQNDITETERSQYLKFLIGKFRQYYAKISYSEIVKHYGWKAAVAYLLFSLKPYTYLEIRGKQY